tara:strand:+ start:71 stop:727 length:657 start_codon:yes stop_codon:yes gene_type:complete
MLVHNICKKHNINSEIEPNKFYLSKKKYFYCSECQKERRRKHYLNNREHELNSHKLWRKENPERSKEICRNWREKNLDKSREIARIWKKENPERKNFSQRKYRKKRRNRDPMFKVLNNLRTRIYTVLTAKHIVKETTTKKLTGCTLEYLKNHLERKFEDGMSWDNYGQWHIDHIRPCSGFNLLDPIEQRVCFHYTNLQPLWAGDNLKKSNREDYYDIK